MSVSSSISRFRRSLGRKPAATELPHDNTAALEHYIPLRKADLVQRLLAEPALDANERTGVEHLCRLLEATIHHEYHERLESLKQAYAPFDPDGESRPPEEISIDERNQCAAQLFDQFQALLERANYRRLSRDELEAALRATSDWSVNVSIDLSLFERLEVFTRGDVVGKKSIRRWQNGFQSQIVDVPTYQRLAVIFQPRPAQRLAQLDSGSVVLKLFKNIPKADIEMLLPGTRVRMTLFDQGRILLPTLSGLGLTAFKLLQGAAALATAGAHSLFAFLGLAAGTVGYGVRSFHGYLRTKDKYQLTLTRSLYYQNLDNNAGVLFRLLDEAEEQEFRETLLAWWLLRSFRQTGATAEMLDRSAEAWLRDRCGLSVDFEVSDALEKLDRLGLAQRLPVSNSSEARWRAADIPTALEALDRAWDNYFRYHQTDPARQTKAA